MGVEGGIRIAAHAAQSAGRFTPAAPSFSPHTADAQAAVGLAWRVTIAAFATLVALLVGGPAAWNWYVGSAIQLRLTSMTSIDGVVFVQRQGTGDWLMAKPEEQVHPGDVLRTAANARAFLTTFDHSTVLLYPSSTFRVLRAEQGRFRPERTSVVVELTQGRARLGIAPPPDPSTAFFQLRTPTAQIHLTEGSYSADHANGETQVSARLGEVTAYSPHGVAAARAGQRVIVPPDRAPIGSQPARRDLVQNGYFVQRGAPAPAGWTFRDTSQQDPPGNTSLDTIPGAVTFQRLGRGHGETVISQVLDADLWDFDQVTLSANVRVLEHSLAGGGWEGTEYPLMLRVVYRDVTGGVTSFYRGFYLHNQDGYPVREGERLPTTDWQRVSVDLLSLVPRPWRIQRVEVVASGWDYTSALGDLHVWAE